jgi:hypothetical protein
MKENYRDCHGHVWTKKEAEMYNKLSNEIDEIEKSGFNKDYLETCKNNRFNLFMAISLNLI